jgi:hypothetical protein
VNANANGKGGRNFGALAKCPQSGPAAGNAGTHIGGLWTSTETLLGQHPLAHGTVNLGGPRRSLPGAASGNVRPAGAGDLDIGAVPRANMSRCGTQRSRGSQEGALGRIYCWGRQQQRGGGRLCRR